MSEPIGIPASRTDEYRGRDLQDEGVWEKDSATRYGLVVFNEQGQVLLREPANHFGGYVWTFSKGQRNLEEHPVDTALRETLEETGYQPEIIGHVPGTFRGGLTKSANCFYLGFDTNGQVDPRAVKRNKETQAIQWATHAAAMDLISLTTDSGRCRDLRTLAAAYAEFEGLVAGSS
jgi:8-oxo-dGTP diphosphatase